MVVFTSLMAQKFLNRPNVVTRFQQMGRETVAECVTTYTFNESFLIDRLPYGPLDNGRMDMMVALFSGFSILPAIFLGKHPLPAPLETELR